MEYLVAPELRTTPSFVLRSFMPGDGAALAEAVESSYAHLAPWMPWAKRTQSLEASERTVREFRARWLLAKEFAVAIAAPDSGMLLGACGYHLREGPLASACAELGMWIRVSHARQGLGTKVLAELLAWGFDEWPWQRQSWRCDSRNVASMRTAEKAGMVREGVLRGQMAEVGDGRCDTVCFAALRSEWASSTSAGQAEADAR